MQNQENVLTEHENLGVKTEGENREPGCYANTGSCFGQVGVSGKKEVTDFPSRARGVKGALRIPW